MADNCSHLPYIITYFHTRFFSLSHTHTALQNELQHKFINLRTVSYTLGAEHPSPCVSVAQELFLMTGKNEAKGANDKLRFSSEPTIN